MFLISALDTRVLRLAGCLAVALLVLAGCRAENDLERARSLQSEGRFEASLEPLRNALVTHPDDPEVLYLNGLALVKTGNSTQAVWSLSKAMEHPEWLARAGLLKASTGLSSKNHELALEAIERILEAEPDQPDALQMRGRIRLELGGDYEGALADAERVLELDSGRRDAKIVRAVALLGLARVEEAGEALEALEVHPDDEILAPETLGQVCAGRAIFAKEKGDPELARERFTRCLEEFPLHPLVVDGAIAFYDESNEPERAIEVLRATLEAEPQAHRFRGALSARLLAGGQTEEAERVLLDATELEASQPEIAWKQLSDYYLAREDYASMASALERAVEVANNPSPDLEFALADALLLAERYDESLALAERLSVPAHRHMIRARVHFEHKRWQEALEELNAGLRLWPNNAAARYYAARAAEQIGDIDRAIEEYRYSIRADPGLVDARYRLALLHEAEGEDELAVQVANSGGARADADVEAQLVALRAANRGGLKDLMANLLQQLQTRPSLRARVLAALAEGTNDRAGPSAAAKRLSSAENLDWTAPTNALLLRSLVMYTSAAGDPGQSARAVESAIAARPEVADFHEIRGLHLEQIGAPPSETRRAYERALELDEAHWRALLGLARLEAAAGSAEAALELQRRAAALAPEGPETAAPRRAMATLLETLARPADAEREWQKLLDDHPFDAEAAASLAALRRSRGAVDARTRELELRAQRFGRPPQGAE
jgi:tetratricopeptide (TPR) repeat protein